jgi:predicted site-specific integrase-resolvase
MNLAARAECNGVARVHAAGFGAVVVDWAEVDDDVVRGMTEILTGLCARRYAQRAAANRAERALTAAGDAEAA